MVFSAMLGLVSLATLAVLAGVGTLMVGWVDIMAVSWLVFWVFGGF